MIHGQSMIPGNPGKEQGHLPMSPCQQLALWQNTWRRRCNSKWLPPSRTAQGPGFWSRSSTSKASSKLGSRRQGAANDLLQTQVRGWPIKSLVTRRRRLDCQAKRNSSSSSRLASSQQTFRKASPKSKLCFLRSRELRDE